MANRIFNQFPKTLQKEVVFLDAEATIGTDGAISGLKGSGISAVTNVSGTGNFSITLEDKFNRFLFGAVSFLAESITAAKTSVTGTAEIQSVVFPAVAGATSGDHFILRDAAGLSWAISLDKTGSAPEPTGALWAAIPAARKSHVDISGGTDAPSVAALIETAFDLLTSVPFTSGTTSATIAFTNTVRALLVPGSVHNSAEGTAGSMTISVGTPGIDSSVEFSATNTFTVVAHGMLTGRKIQTSISGGGTLPNGITTTTDYWVIKIDANNFKLAASLADAQAGTAIAIGDQGTAAKTITYTPFAPFGSAVAQVEFTSTDNDALVQAGSAIPFSTYDFAGALIDPTPLTKIKVLLVLRNSSLEGKGE